jgi:hemolysin D
MAQNKGETAVALNEKTPARLVPYIDDRAFLPAALEIIETPASPVAVAMIGVICAFILAAFAWCWFGRLDVYATARGKFIPTGHTKVIQPLETGKVIAIDVTPHQTIKAGDVVLELNPSEVTAEIAADSEAMLARRAETLRRRTALAAATAGELSSPPPIAWPDVITDEIRQREERVLAGDLSELAAAIEHLEKQRLEKEASVKELEGRIAAQSRLLETLKERVALKQTLIDRNVGTKTGLYDALQALREGETQLAGFGGKLDEAIAAVVSIKTQRVAKLEEFLADNARKLAEAGRQANEKEADLVKTLVKLEHMTLRSPVDGIVESFTVTSIGQVVTTGQELMRIVPSDARLQIQAFVNNEDIGFVSPGQDAVVKVDAFPFSRYGTLNATVEEVAKDAIPSDTANRGLVDQTKSGSQSDKTLTPTAEPMANLVFETKLRPNATTISINDKDLELVPGMTVVVEIKTGSRRIIEYLFSPLLEVAGKAMKER